MSRSRHSLESRRRRADHLRRSLQVQAPTPEHSNVIEHRLNATSPPLPQRNVSLVSGDSVLKARISLRRSRQAAGPPAAPRSPLPNLGPGPHQAGRNGQAGSSQILIHTPNSAARGVGPYAAISAPALGKMVDMVPSGATMTLVVGNGTVGNEAEQRAAGGRSTSPTESSCAPFATQPSSFSAERHSSWFGPVLAPALAMSHARAPEAPPPSVARKHESAGKQAQPMRDLQSIFDGGSLASHISTSISRALRREWTPPPSLESGPPLRELIALKESACKETRVCTQAPPAAAANTAVWPLNLTLSPRKEVWLPSGVPMPAWAVDESAREVDVSWKHAVSPRTLLYASGRATRTSLGEVGLKLVSSRVLLESLRRGHADGPDIGEAAGRVKLGFPCMLSASFVSDLVSRKTLGLEATLGLLDREHVSAVVASSQLGHISYALASSHRVSETLRVCSRVMGAWEKEKGDVLKKVVVQAIHQQQGGLWSLSPVISIQPGRVPVEGGVLWQKVPRSAGLVERAVDVKMFVNSRGGFQVSFRVSRGETDLETVQLSGRQFA